MIGWKLCAFLCLNGSLVLAASGDSEKKSPTIFSYEGQAYTASDVTLVSYEEYQRSLEDAQRVYDPAKHRLSTGLRPGGFIPDPKHPDDFQRFYKQQLNGTISLFVADQVLQEVKRKFGKEIVAKYIDETAVEPYIQKMTEVEQGHAKAAQNALDHATDAKSFMEFAEKEFPTNMQEESYAQSYKFLTTSRPYWQFNVSCFPSVKEGRVTPWMRWELEAPLTRYWVQALIEQDKPKYIAMLNQKCLIEGIAPIQDTRSSPPSFLYDVAEDAILRPIFADVVRSLELSEGYSLPPMKQLIGQSRGRGITTSRFGRPMPKVVAVQEEPLHD